MLIALEALALLMPRAMGALILVGAANDEGNRQVR